ncbi:MAG TPA: metal ABC transporter ATP-binding protein [Candidatus Saccharimonadales bacterium]
MTQKDDDLIIKSKKLAAGYGKKVIWKNATFSVRQGEFVAIIGPNGAGKSTLFRLLLGLQQPLSGSLTVKDQEPKKASRTIGYVPQRRAISSQTTLAARELVKLGFNGNKLGFNLSKKAINQRVDEVLGLVDAKKLAEKSLGQLSGGELQRIFLAQALIGSPDILLLDEPLSNLDLRRENELVMLVKKLATQHNITVLLIAHDLNPLMPVIDSVIYVANGQVVSGETDKVLTSEMLSKLYKSRIEVLKDSSGRLVIVGSHGVEHHV